MTGKRVIPGPPRPFFLMSCSEVAYSFVTRWSSCDIGCFLFYSKIHIKSPFLSLSSVRVQHHSFAPKIQLPQHHLVMFLFRAFTLGFIRILWPLHKTKIIFCDCISTEMSKI